jgi:CBS domain-containing protein
MADISDVLRHKGAIVHGIAASRTVYEAIAEMTRHDIGALLVWGPDGAPVGIVTERDYLKYVALEGRSSKTTRVEEIMSAPLVSVGPRTTVAWCMETMTRMRLRHLPVMQGGDLVGLVSIGDLVKHELKTRQDTIDGMVHYIGGYPPVSEGNRLML